MKGTFKRSFFFFIIVLNLAVAALYSQISTNTDFQPQMSGQLSELLSGKSANVDEIILSLPETDLPAALGVAEQLSFKALHNDIPMSPEAVAKVRQTIENRMQKAKSVSLQSSEQCPVSVPARRLNVAGTEITVPSYFVTDQPIIISQTPTGEAGTFFPTISVTVAAAPGAKLHGSLLLNGKPFPLKQESSTSLIYRPSPSAENALSIGTHTAQITVTDARGRAASATWSFTVGIKPTAQPPIDPAWPVVGSFSVPLSHLIGNSAVSGNVQIIVYQTPDGKTIQKLVVTGGKGAGELTTQDPFWLGAIFNRRNHDPSAITMTPKTSLAFPGNSLVFTYSYSGIGTVAKEEWVIREGSSTRKSLDASVSWTMGKVPVRAIIYLTISVTDANGDPSEAYASEGKGINPILPSGLFGPWRFMSISEMATGSVPFSVQPGILIGDQSYLLIREDPLVLGNHLVFVEDANVEQIGGNTHPTFEDSTATKTNLLFSQPGWAEFRHVMRLRLACGDETYKTTFELDSYPLIGHYQASATLKFSKLPPGIIAGTQRKANVSEVALTMNKESKTFSASTLADPWVLARSTTKPNSTPLAVSGLRIVIPENNIALPFDDFSVVLDPQFHEDHPAEFFFTPHIRPVTATIDSDIRNISTRKTFTVPLYSEEALLETAFEPGEDLTILENQNVDFTTVVKPVPGKGTGELKAGAGEIDLLEGYKVKKLEMLVWGQAHESEMPSEELKKPKRTNDVHWSYSFKPDKGTGTYFIGNGCYAMAYEPETESEGPVSGGGQRTVTVIPGLKILSPKANFAYPQDIDIIVKTTFDSNPVEWNKIKWSIGSSEVHPTPTAPGWSLKLPPGKYTLKAMYSPPNTQPVTESVTFQVVPISLKITPERKITALPGSSTVPLKLTLSVNEVEIAKPGEEFNWPATGFKAIASVSWVVFTAPANIAEFDQTKPYEPQIIFSDKPTAVTALATVTLQVFSNSPGNSSFSVTLPLARADIWGLQSPEWSTLSGKFPNVAIKKTKRLFAPEKGAFVFNGTNYNWSVQSGIDPIVQLSPAIPDIEAVEVAQLDFSWQGPNNQVSSDVQFSPDLKLKENTTSVFFTPQINFGTPGVLSFPKIEYKIALLPLGEVIDAIASAVPDTVPINSQSKIRFYFGPENGEINQQTKLSVLKGEYEIDLKAVAWREASLDDFEQLPISQTTPTISFSKSIPGEYYVVGSGSFFMTPKEGAEYGAYDSVSSGLTRVLVTAKLKSWNVSSSVVDHLERISTVNNFGDPKPYNECYRENGHWVWQQKAGGEIATQPLAVGCDSTVFLQPEFGSSRPKVTEISYKWLTENNLPINCEGSVKYEHGGALIPTPSLIGVYQLQLSMLGCSESATISPVYVVKRITNSTFNHIYFVECIKDSSKALSNFGIEASDKVLIDAFYDWWWQSEDNSICYGNESGAFTYEVIQLRSGMCQGLGNYFYKALACQGVTGLTRIGMLLSTSTTAEDSITEKMTLNKGLSFSHKRSDNPWTTEYWGATVYTDAGLNRQTPAHSYPDNSFPNIYCKSKFQFYNKTSLIPQTATLSITITYPWDLDFDADDDFPCYCFPAPDGHAIVTYDDVVTGKTYLYDPSFGGGKFGSLEIGKPKLGLVVVKSLGNQPRDLLLWNYLSKSIAYFRGYTFFKSDQFESAMSVFDVKVPQVNFLRVKFIDTVISQEDRQ